MLRSKSSTSSASSYQTGTDSSIREGAVGTPSFIERAANLTDAAINLPRRASTNLALREQPSSICGKRRADNEDSTDRRVKPKTPCSMTAKSNDWVLLTNVAETARSKSLIRPATKRRERMVKAESGADDSASDADTSNVDVEDGRDGSMPEISMRSSNLLFITSPESEVNDDPMIRSDISLAGTDPVNDYVFVANAFANLGVARLATGSMPAALIGIGTQFGDPIPFMKIRGDDSILV